MAFTIILLNIENPMNQSKLEIHVADPKRGKTCSRVTIGQFCVYSDWMKKIARVF